MLKDMVYGKINYKYSSHQTNSRYRYLSDSGLFFIINIKLPPMGGVYYSRFNNLDVPAPIILAMVLLFKSLPSIFFAS